jgi:zinc transport system substrate-binding protein
MFKKMVILFSLFSVAIFGSACTVQSEQVPIEQDGVKSVFVSIIPQQYFVNRIAGDLIDVQVMVLPGESPATYEPSPEQMAALDRAEVYFSIGVPFESVWLERIASANPDMLVIDTAAGIDKLPIVEHVHGEDEHEDDIDPVAEEGAVLDPHIWTSPALVKIQAQNIYDGLVALAPEHQTAFKENLAVFLADIANLEAHIENALADKSNRTFMVFHPAWGYFADQFNLVQIPIELGGTEPSPSELAQLIDKARAEGIKIIFVQPEFSTRSAETIAKEIDGSVIMINSLSYEWLENLEAVANQFSDVLN